MKSQQIFYCICFVLPVLALCAYFPVLSNPFINYDDPVYITNNNHVKAGLTLDGLRWAFTTFHSANWHPVTWLSHMLDVEFFGLEAKAHHLISLLLHIANSLLIFIFFYIVSHEIWKSAVVAIFFAIHPIHIESVVWAAERKDLLSTFFELLSLVLYVQYVLKPEIRKYILTLLLFMIALMSKPMTVTLPIIMLIIDFWPLNRMNILNHSHYKTTTEVIWFLVKEKSPFIFLSILTGIITIFAQKEGDALRPVYEIAVNERILNSIYSYTIYLWKTFVPVDFAIFYPHPGNTLSIFQIFCSSVFFIAITYGTFRKVARYPFLAAGWVWYLVTLFPVIGIIQVGNQGYADRYTYMPLVGIFVMIAWGWPILLPEFSSQKIFSKVIMIAATAILIYLTQLNVRYWRSSSDLFTHANEVTENNYVAYNNIGTLMIEKGEFKKAETFFLKALNAKPDYAVGHVNIANAFMLQQKFDLAINHYKEAIQFNSRDKSGLFNLGVALLATKKLDDAINIFEKILEQDPGFSQAHLYLGNIYLSKKDINKAIPFYSSALQLNPESVDGHINIGIALASKGEMSEAIRHLNQALTIDSANDRAKALLRQFLSILKK